MPTENKRINESPGSAQKRVASGRPGQPAEAAAEPMQAATSVARIERAAGNNDTEEPPANVGRREARAENMAVADLHMVIYFYARRLSFNREQMARIMHANSVGSSNTESVRNELERFNSMSIFQQFIHWHFLQRANPYAMLNRPIPIPVQQANAPNAPNAPNTSNTPNTPNTEAIAAAKEAEIRRRAEDEVAMHQVQMLGPRTKLYKRVTGFRLVRFLPDGTGIHDSSDGNVSDGYSNAEDSDREDSSDDSAYYTDGEPTEESEDSDDSLSENQSDDADNDKDEYEDREFDEDIGFLDESSASESLEPQTSREQSLRLEMADVSVS